VHFCRIASIYQPTNAHIISHKTLWKHFKTLRHVSILSDHHQRALFLAKVMSQYSQFSSYLQTTCCGSISCCVGMCCGAVARCASCEAHRATAPHQIPTQHDMLPKHLVCKYELNCEYCNITLARNKALWWWSDKIETCRSVLKCFESVLCEIIRAFVGWWIEVICMYSLSHFYCFHLTLPPTYVAKVKAYLFVPLYAR
jgi:hypothetical protein